MNKNRKYNAVNLILLMISSLTYAISIQAQSSDIDAPTVLIESSYEIPRSLSPAITFTGDHFHWRLFSA